MKKTIRKSNRIIKKTNRYNPFIESTRVQLKPSISRKDKIAAETLLLIFENFKNYKI